MAKGGYKKRLSEKAIDGILQTNLGVVGKNIRSLREVKKISQLKLAYLSYVERAIISKIENGHAHNPSLLTLAKIAYQLDVTVNDLFKPAN